MPDVSAVPAAADLAGLRALLLAVLLALGAAFSIAFIWRRAEELALAAALATSAALVLAVALRPAVEAPGEGARPLRVAAAIEASAPSRVRAPDR